MAYAGDFTKSAGNYNIGKQILDETITLSRYVDCTSSGREGNLTSAGVYKLFSVPAKFSLTSAYVICHVAEGGSATVNITDDDSSTTVFVNGASIETVGNIQATNARKEYPSAGYICVIPSENLDTAKFWVIVTGIVISTSM